MRTVPGYGLLLLLLVATLSADWAEAQNYPNRPVRIRTTPAGSGGDTVSRIVASNLSGPLGQPVVIDNAPAASLGTSVVAAVPDGYTLLITGGTLWIAPMFGEASSYDAIRDFAPIARLTRAPSLLIVNTSLPVKSVEDVIRLAKASPGTLNYSTGSDGSASHISGELLKSIAGINIVRISYKGGTQDMADLLSGRIQMTFGSTAAFGTQINAGKVRALATTGSQRSIVFPDLPMASETLPGFVSEQVLGLFAPAKIPDAIVKRLNQEAVRLIEKSDVRELLLRNGLEPGGGTAEQFAEAIKSEVAKVSKIIKDAGVKPGGS